MELYTKNRAQADDTGVALIPKLKYEHVHLTSYSKMRVDLAAQERVILFQNRRFQSSMYL